MNKFRSNYSILLVVGLLITGLVAQASGQLYRNEREIRDITRQIKNKVDNFQMSLSNNLRRSSIDRQDKEELEDNVQNVKDSVRDFEKKFDRQRETADDVKKVLENAKTVNDFIKYNSIDSRTDKDWLEITAQLDRLASNYNVYWSWDDNSAQYPNNNYPTNSGNSYSAGLTGTYQLNESKSEDTAEIADRAIRNSNSRDDQANRDDLVDKLQAPEQIAIEIRGSEITLGTSLAQPISFTANGRELVQTTDDGKTIRVKTILRGQDLTISSLGGDTDYTIIFSSTENGKSMKVSRRVTTNYLRQTVFADSVYEKTDSVARLGGSTNSGDYSDNSGYSSNDPNDRNYPTNNPTNYPSTTNGRSGNFIVRDGVVLTGTLDNDIDTKVSQNSDRFRMTVQSPNEYRGAVVEGYLTGIDRSGKVTGRSEVTFNFQTIRLANGYSYEFAGNLQSVRDENGKTIKIDQEGAAKGDSQTKETVKRTGIGAGLGALIGAIAGGAKGAAIGAVIGGGAGAGSVVLQGKDDLKLKAGSQITVQSSSPLR